MSKSAIKILNTAEALFNQHSFSSVGVDLIRDESGCSKTTLYTHFTNKQHLVEAVLSRRDQRFRANLIEKIGDATGLDALEKIFDWHIAWFQADHFKGCLFVRATAEADQQDNAIQYIAKQHKSWLYQLIQQHSQSLKNAEQVTLLFYTQLEGLISRCLVEGFNLEQANQQKKLIFQLIALLQNQTL